MPFDTKQLRAWQLSREARSSTFKKVDADVARCATATANQVWVYCYVGRALQYLANETVSRAARAAWDPKYSEPG